MNNIKAIIFNSMVANVDVTRFLMIVVLVQYFQTQLYKMG